MKTWQLWVVIFFGAFGAVNLITHYGWLVGIAVTAVGAWGLYDLLKPEKKNND